GGLAMRETGSPKERTGQASRNGYAEPEPAGDLEPEDINPDDPEEVAGVEDLRQAGAEMKWGWPGWIQKNVLNLLLADSGVGKTRLAADKIRRVRHQQTWPDGQAMTWSADSRFLWVVADLHHAELVKLCTDFDIMASVKVNAYKKADVFGG